MSEPLMPIVTVLYRHGSSPAPPLVAPVERPDGDAPNDNEQAPHDSLESIVTTQGATLLTCPPTPALRHSQPDPAFTEKLRLKLETLIARQEARVNTYGESFAREWPISRTPRALAEQAAAEIRSTHDEMLHLDSESEPESEEEKTRKWRFLRMRRTKHDLSKSRTRVTALPTTFLATASAFHRPSQQSNLKRKRSDVSSPPRLKSQRTS